METKPTIRGVIENIEVKSGTSKAGKAYDMTILTIAGKKYSNFGKFEFDQGDELQIVVEQKGEYLNFRDPVMIKPSDGTQPVITQETISDSHLKTKTILAEDPEKFDEAINGFNANHNVSFTQTNLAITTFDGAYKTIMMATLFYK